MLKGNIMKRMNTKDAEKVFTSIDFDSKKQAVNILAKKYQGVSKNIKVLTNEKKYLQDSLQTLVGDGMETGTFNISNTPFDKSIPAYAKMIDGILEALERKKKGTMTIGEVRKLVSDEIEKNTVVKASRKFLVTSK